MAKKKKLDDLDAELAALEAELAALEGKAAPAAAPRKAPAREVVTPDPEGAVAEALEQEEAARKKRRLRFAKQASGGSGGDAAPAEGAAAKLTLPFGRKKATAQDVPPAAAPAPAGAAITVPVMAQSPAMAASDPLPEGDLTHWRQEAGTWIRAIPGHEGPVVRRVLDEEGATVREEPATRAELEEVTGVKAERGVGRLLGSASGAAAKLKGLRFGRKGGNA